MTKTIATRLVMLAFVCSLGSLASRPAEQPLSVDDVRLLLIGGAAPAKMEALIAQRGINFHLTPELEKNLRDDGADDSVIQELRKAQDKPAPAPGRAPVASPQREQSPHEKSAPENEPHPSSESSSDREAAETAAAAHPTLINRSATAGPSPRVASPQPAATPPAEARTPAPTTRHTEVPGIPPAAAGRPPAPDLSDPPPDQIQKIIQEFAAKEKTFKAARNNYTYRQDNRVEEYGPDGEIGGTYEQGWDILFDDAGKRIEHVYYAPENTLKQLILTAEDLNAFRSINPFVLTSDELPDYEVKYLGHVKVDEITAYVFSIRPKEIAKAHQYFQGTIWVDDRDLQIVKSEGKSVGVLKKSKEENLFPRFTTYREQIDGKYWFPTFTSAEDTLYFSHGPSVHMKEIIRYSDYKQFKSKTRILSATPTDEPNAKPITEPPPKDKQKQ